MRIGLVTRYYPPIVRGGSHLSVYYIARGLAERGVDVHVFTSALPRKMKDNGENRGIQVHRIFDYGYSKNMRELDYGSVMMARKLRRWLNNHNVKFDVLHSYGMDTIPAVWINRKHGKSVASVNGWWATCPVWDHTSPENQVCTVCSLPKLLKCQYSKRSGRLTKKLSATLYLFASLNLKKKILAKMSLLLPISNYVKQLLFQNGFDLEKMRVCPSMLDPSEYEKLNKHFLHEAFDLDEHTRIILYAGRFANYKGIRYLVEAIPEVLREHKDVTFLFVGHGAEKENILNQTKTLGNNRQVILGSFIDPKKMPDAYASSYCVVMPSTWPEPLGRVEIEGLASGTAVIASNTGGIPEVISNGETGLLVKPFSSDAIAKAVSMLLADERLRDSLAETGRKVVLEKYSIHNQTKHFITAYETVARVPLTQQQERIFEEMTS